MNAHFLVDCCLWIYAGISFVSFAVDQTRKSAPKRNRLVAPSRLCERTGQFEVNLSHTVFGRRQGE
jgi:hypothetical protein